MEFLAYAFFILLLMVPFVLVACVVGGFVYGLTLLTIGISTGRTWVMVLGLLLTGVSATVGWTLTRWATTPPGENSGSLHRTVHSGYQSLRMRNKAQRMMQDGTFERLAAEQRARDAAAKERKEQQPPATDQTPN